VYLFDSDLRIWCRPNGDRWSYTDGDEEEDYLLQVVRNAKDVSSTSPELAASIRDWPSEYHLSPTRHNLLRCVDVGPGQRVIELGCGCGAMTRYLGETGATVVAVEGSRRRATIAAERCRDLANVSVYCDNLIAFEAEGAADVVTLIGVLEYSPLFVDGVDPVLSCLEKARCLLAEDGFLVLAIENQIGLKYFNGCSEDHTGVPYFGINDLYDAKTAITFGKKEIESKLRGAAFSAVSFFYPFPDYKLPEVILSEDAFHQRGFRVSELLFRAFSRDYSGSVVRAFHEFLAWKPLERNGLMSDLANSFLVLAQKGCTVAKQPRSWLAKVYNTRRLPCFATETVFYPDAKGVVVFKRLLFPDVLRVDRDVSNQPLLHTLPLEEDYVAGQLYATELQAIIARGGDLAAIVEWASPWVKRLVEAARPEASGAMTLPGSMIDSVPGNLVRDDSGQLVDIDREWTVASFVPLHWVLIRGVVNSLTACPVSPIFKGLSFKDAVTLILRPLGRAPSEDDFQVAIVLEDALQEQVSGTPKGKRSFHELLAGPVCSAVSHQTFHQEILALRQEVASASREVSRIKATVSWHITKPLRFAWNLIRRLIDSRALRK